MSGCVAVPVAFVLLASISQCSAADDHLVDDEIITRIMNNFEIGALRPQSRGPPINVTCSMYINSVHSIKEVDMEYSTSFYLHLQWLDRRLRHNGTTSITLNSPEFIDVVWRPDVYFDNEKRGEYHKVTTDNRALEIGFDGSIQYSLRLNMALSCQMKLHNFPVDKHKCRMTMLSYAYESKDLLLRWRDENPVTVFAGNEMPQFTLRKFEYREDLKTHINSKTKSYLEVVFYLEREMGYYILINYIPSTFLVILSWVSFWLQVDCTPGRVALGITTVLTTATQLSIARGSLEVSYATAIDIWMTTCMFFVFAAMIEFAIVNYLAMTDPSKEKSLFACIQRKRCPDYEQAIQMQNRPFLYKNDAPFNDNCNEEKNENSAEFGKTRQGQSRSRRANLAYKVDKLSRLVFPVCFLVFNIIYWIVYLHFT
ncbi:glycine receptor subunit alpha-2-like [Ptychodera flava]|uniref:glycine receptor subunit alpha-2-like n=1 Tax=Ptychodera flava TaxID=63121 RepID=UPI00396A1732